MTLDFDAINAVAWDHIAAIALEIDPGAKKEGSEWVMNAHWRGEQGRNSLKANLQLRFIRDFGADEGFDPVSLFARHRDISNGAAAKELQDRFCPRPAAIKAESSKTTPKKSQWVRHAPLEAPAPAFAWKKGFRFVRAWEVRDVDGSLVGYRARFDGPNGKEVPWWTWRRFQDGTQGWKAVDPDQPKPLTAGPQRLAAQPDDLVLVVEGEKTAERAQDLFPRLVVVTSGSSSSASSADWSPLKGRRRVVIWPDADEPGRKYADAVAIELQKIGITPSVVDTGALGLPVGWDLADPFPTGWLDSTPQDLIDEAQPHVQEVSVEPTKPHKFQRTQFGLADRFLARFGHLCRFNDSTGRWMAFDGTRWADSAGRVEIWAQQVIRDLVKELDGVPDEKRSEHIKFMVASQCASTVTALLQLARAQVTCTASSFDLDPWALNCPNGTLDLRTGNLRPHNPADMLSKLTGTTFDTSAQAPRWLKMIREITSEPGGREGFTERPELGLALQIAVGYALTGSVREQCLFFLIGGGSNGKGVFLEVLRTILGDYSKVVPSSLIIAKDRDPHPADVATLVGVRLAIVQEVNKRDAWDEAKVKGLTGADSLTARFMHGNFFEFCPAHKFLIAANHRPNVCDASHAFWRRMRMIPFDRRFDGAQKDPLLLEKLKAELPGILAWCVQGCLAWQKQGLIEAQPSADAVKAYREDSSGFAMFMAARFQPSPHGSVRAKNFKELYEAWALDSGDPFLSSKAIWHALQEFATAQGFQVRKVLNNGTVFQGIRMIENEMAEGTELTEGESTKSPLGRLAGRFTPIPSVPSVPSAEDVLDLREERAAILEFQGGFSRLEADGIAGLTSKGAVS